MILDFEKSANKKVVIELLNRGLIDAWIDEDGEIVLQLTEAGKKAFKAN